MPLGPMGGVIKEILADKVYLQNNNVVFINYYYSNYLGTYFMTPERRHQHKEQLPGACTADVICLFVVMPVQYLVEEGWMNQHKAYLIILPKWEERNIKTFLIIIVNGT